MSTKRCRCDYCMGDNPSKDRRTKHRFDLRRELLNLDTLEYTLEIRAITFKRRYAVIK